MNLMDLVFYPVDVVIDFVSNIDYQVLAAKAVVKTVEVGIEIIKWSLQ